jgi:uncharacterized damage-inducible protein DinB
MYTSDVLLDIHQRAHASLRDLIGFCGRLTPEELQQPLPGFGFPSVMRQLRHTIGAELYWQMVLTQGYHREVDLPPLPDLAAIEAFRQRIAAVTRDYLQQAEAAELNTRREMVTDPGETSVHRPSDIIVRLATHIFNHQGQVLAMCRSLGKPNEEVDLDYPLGEM